MQRIRLILAAVLVLAFVGALVPTHTAAAPAGSTTITIIHTNDLHGRFVGNDSNIIGIDRIAAIYANTDNAILVDAGDTLHGLPFVNLSRGLNAVKLMNAAGYRIMAPGNHDFNYSINAEIGANHLLYLENYADFDILAANVTWVGTGEGVFTAYTLVEIDGVTIGFFGLATPDTPVVTHPDGVRDFNFGDPVPAARAAVASLQAAGADIIVGVTHIGTHGRNSSVAVAEQVEGIDVIIDGHCHTLLEEGRLVNGVLIAMAGEHGQHVGMVEITVADGALVSANASVINHEAAQAFEPCPTVAGMIRTMQAENDAILDTVVAYSPIFLTGERSVVRGEEAAIGNLIADALRWNVGADIAIANGGGIRDDINIGNLTIGDISAVLPFINFSVKVEINPAILWQALENGVSTLPDGGRFPQISGFSFTYDATAEYGYRVQSVTKNGVALGQFDTTTTFTLAINDFMSVGGDGYSMFIGLPPLAQGDLMADLLTAYIYAHDISNTRVEGRIVSVAGVAPVAIAETVVTPVPIVAPITIVGGWSLPIPVYGQSLTYVAAAGETLWSIAYNFYGSMQEDVINRIFAANAEALRANNGAVAQGMVLTLPANGLRDPITRTHIGQFYLVRAGDTLGSIAQYFFGNSAYAYDIFNANRTRIRNINQIFEGQWIVIPF
ncbi:MAG: 5'-nucleotidase C-terminal domain-containing protein [Defluviitaleaceae bacterium]|nr:5'-nucleotidase C-terminal domain-containing protein [Defluviitaleaceae bacterium]